MRTPPHPDDVDGWIAELRSATGADLDDAVSSVIRLRHHHRPEVIDELAEVYRQSPNLRVSLPEMFLFGAGLVPREASERFFQRVLSQGVGPGMSAERYIELVNYVFLEGDDALGELAEPVMAVFRAFAEDPASTLTRSLVWACGQVAFAIPREEGIAYLRALSENPRAELAEAGRRTLPYFFEED